MANRYIIGTGMIGVFLLIMLAPRPALDDHDHWRLAGRDFHVIAANDARSRQQGLSGSTSLDDDTVMLFVFPSDGLHGIWMKDMRFAIDILWLDESWTVVHIEEHVQPDTYPSVFSPGRPARYVVELNAGTLEQLNIHQGQQLEAWPSG